MIYEFRTPRRSARPKLNTTSANVRQPDESIGMIQGQVPDSRQEWWVAKALNRIGIPYTYQYPIQGGRTRGGYLIDFVVQTVPLATMFEVEGNHWHTGELGADDKKRKADIEDIMQDQARTPIESLWVPDLLDEDTVFMKLRSILG